MTKVPDRRMPLPDETMAELEFVSELSERKKPAVVKRLIAMAAESLRRSSESQDLQKTLQRLGL